ncbi:zinc protease [Loktanella fryxellensis]|uniref:Zinc protease n=1 Tax=Loktanella fryxellensis TaxID=245187 RepID=A0A1H7ZWR3_9RHOB|nr:pitrilysin family protein [Loktanella fryxellensis]SEM61737.1 zinc protease [Loktanella fryxellensis]
MIRILTLCLTLVAGTAHAAVEIEEVTSPGGIEAWLVEDHNIPFTALEIRIVGGAALDAPGKRGATNLMMALLEEGADDLTAQAFQTRREELAASYGFDADDDMVAISAQMLTENRDEAVALLRSALVAPRFDQDAVDRVRAQVLANIASDEKSPGDIASRALDAAAFGDHPYGASLSGTVESVTALTRDDIVVAHRATLTRDRVYVGAVGDITPEDLGALLDDLLGDLPAATVPLPDDADYALTGGVTVIPYDTPQSVALFGHRGITRDDPDYMAAYILNEALGAGGFESRLMQEVREERGLTYGISTFLVPQFYGELILGQLGSSNSTMAEAIDVIRAEWARMATDGMTQEELDRVKTYLTGAYPLRFDGNASIATILVGMQVIDLPPSYVVDRNAQLNAVTLDDVNRVARELLRPDDLRFVVVGQPEGLTGDPAPGGVLPQDAAPAPETAPADAAPTEAAPAAD